MVAVTLLLGAGSVFLAGWSWQIWQTSNITSAVTYERDLTSITKVASVQAAPIPTLILGDPNARTTLVFYGDTACVDCGRFVREVLPELELRYLSVNRLKIVYVPLPFVSSGSLMAGEASYCAGEQGLFSEYYKRMMLGNEVSRVHLTDLAVASGLKLGEFTSCLESGRYTNVVRSNTDDARSRSLTDVPAFLLGGRILRGYQPASVIEALLTAEGL